MRIGSLQHPAVAVLVENVAGSNAHAVRPKMMISYFQGK